MNDRDHRLHRPPHPHHEPLHAAGGRGGGARRTHRRGRDAGDAPSLARCPPARRGPHLRAARPDARLRRSAPPPADGRGAAAAALHHRDGVAPAVGDRGPDPRRGCLPGAPARDRAIDCRSRGASHHLGLPRDLARSSPPPGAEPDLRDPAGGGLATLVPRPLRQRRGARLDGPRRGDAGAPPADRRRNRPLLRDRPRRRQRPHDPAPAGARPVSRRPAPGAPGGAPRRAHHHRGHGVRALRPGAGVGSPVRRARPRRHPVPGPHGATARRTRAATTWSPSLRGSARCASSTPAASRSTTT